jgi:hypothetical protein
MIHESPDSRESPIHESVDSMGNPRTGCGNPTARPAGGHPAPKSDLPGDRVAGGRTCGWSRPLAPSARQVESPSPGVQVDGRSGSPTGNPGNPLR